MTFQECPDCSAKPGCPQLCPDCLRRRREDAESRRVPGVVIETLQLCRKCLVGSHEPNRMAHGEPAKARTKECKTCDAIEQIDVLLKNLTARRAG